MTHDLAQMLVQLLAQYRERNSQQDPRRIEMSEDVFRLLLGYREPGFSFDKSSAGYSLDGIPVVPNSSQALPFIFRP